MYADPSGCFWDYVLDFALLGYGISDFIKKPSWGKAGMLLLDVCLSILPFVPAISSARHLNKVDDLVDLTKMYGHIDNFADAGGIIRFANKADFADDGWDLVNSLNKVDGFTVSNTRIGTKIHKTFGGGGKLINFANRVDGIDDIGRIVFELKPYNVRSIRRGIKQLNRYQNVLYDLGNGLYKMVFVVY